MLGEFGYSYQGYGGSYAVQADGTITVELKAYPRKWPAMKMAREGKAVRLYPLNGDNRFEFGGRAGAVETGHMKPFWPFRLVAAKSTPEVSPIWTNGTLRSFISPVLPEDFVWKGDKISFRIDFDLGPTGKAVLRQYWTSDTSSGQYDKNDWRARAATCAITAARQWSFYPALSDGKPVPSGNNYEVEASRKDGAVRWRIQSGNRTIYDNMPRETNR